MLRPFTAIIRFCPYHLRFHNTNRVTQLRCGDLNISYHQIVSIMHEVNKVARLYVVSLR